MAVLGASFLATGFVSSKGRRPSMAGTSPDSMRPMPAEPEAPAGAPRRGDAADAMIALEAVEKRFAGKAELATLVRLDAAMLDRYPGELSGGQRQRVGLMRALMLDPDLLLFDEPMGALDPLVRARLQEDLKRIFAELGKTVLLVTHDLAE